MKRFLCIGLLLSLLALVPCNGSAELQRYSIQELPSVTSLNWEQTYEAYGRTIEVNEDIFIPSASAAPVITVQSAPPVADPLFHELEAKYAQALKDDLVNFYGFFSSGFRTTVDHATPPGWGKTRDSEYNLNTMGWSSHALYEYDMNTAYAEANSITVAEAVDIAKSKVAELFSDEKLHLRNVAIYDRNYWKKSHEPIECKGHYQLELSQTFHDIPFLASIHSAFTRLEVGNENLMLNCRGIMMSSIYDAESYSFTCWFYQEQEIRYDDIPLLPFDAVKGEVEALIRKGYVRSIDNVSLGYVQFDTEDPDEQILVPSWVVWCEYMPEGPRAERDRPLYTDGLFQNAYFRPLIINAQTGEMVDPESEEIGRCLCPPIIIR